MSADDASRPLSTKSATSAVSKPPEKKAIERTAVFRGNWVPTIDRPTQFGQYQFLPTPPPQVPRKKAQEEPKPVVEQIVEEEEEEKPAEPILVGERMTGPSPEWDVWLTVLDREKDYRSCITKTGEVYNNMGQLIGYVNVESNECGSSNEMFLGCVIDQPYDNMYQVRDSEDDLVGYIDMVGEKYIFLLFLKDKCVIFSSLANTKLKKKQGTASVKDAMGGSVVDLESGGICKHPNGTYLGQFLGARGFHDMRILALYLCLLDPGMCSDVTG